MLTYYERGILPRAISQEMFKISICKMSLKITILKSFTHLPGANELTQGGLVTPFGDMLPSDTIWWHVA